MKSESQMLLKIFENGGTVKDQRGLEYGMDEDGNVLVLFDDDSGKGYKIDMHMSSFKKLAEQIGRDELWMKCCAIELRKIKGY